ncbi:Dolichyl-phosphate-mannose-protein mannosyltransferase [Actinopolymorpha cephalotaxi]|uniref:Dolichyl-phosphate-mannose-protein mannosyltransferase n=2 Tax=Actinopolymorpha cephalotaxi TaxID=504797 RepID=A0A1I2SMS3_9ACTN|nr:Dolichyl-phosphate-mannose-protein mannosyltransferase [Actinopolymorpha cephalotaxi]
MGGRFSAVRPGTLTVVVGLLLAVGVGIAEVLYRLPVVRYDQVNYMNAARAFPDQARYAPMHQLLRYGLIVPMRMAQELFGYSEAAYLAVPMVAGIGLAVGVYGLSVLLFNRWVGLAAGALTVGNSLVFQDLTTPLPDLLATAILCWALVIVVAVRQRRRLVTCSPTRETGALLGIGLLLGWSYLTREFIVPTFGLVPLVLLGRVPVRRMLWIALPLAGVAIGEAVFNFAHVGDPLARLHASEVHGHAGPKATAAWQLANLGHPPLWYLGRLPVALASTPEGLALILCVVGTLLGALYSRKIAFLLAWTLLFYVPLVLLGGILDPWHPKLRINVGRYWTAIIPALVLGGVACAWLLIHNRAKVAPYLRHRTRLAGIVAGLALLAVVAVPVGIAQNARATGETDPFGRYAANGATELEQFRTWLTRKSSTVRVLRADPSTIRVLNVYLNPLFGRPSWNGRIAVMHKIADARRGQYVVIYSARSETCQSCMNDAQHIYGKPVKIPSTWRQVVAIHDRRIEVYQVG